MTPARENLHTLWQNISCEDPAWKILKEGDLLFLKSPIPCTKFQLAWGLHTEEDFKKACTFFEENDFACFLDAQSPPAFSFHSTLRVDIIEMEVKRWPFMRGKVPSLFIKKWGSRKRCGGIFILSRLRSRKGFCFC